MCISSEHFIRNAFSALLLTIVFHGATCLSKQNLKTWSVNPNTLECNDYKKGFFGNVNCKEALRAAPLLPLLSKEPIFEGKKVYFANRPMEAIVYIMPGFTYTFETKFKSEDFMVGPVFAVTGTRKTGTGRRRYEGIAMVGLPEDVKIPSNTSTFLMSEIIVDGQSAYLVLGLLFDEMLDLDKGGAFHAAFHFSDVIHALNLEIPKSKMFKDWPREEKDLLEKCLCFRDTCKRYIFRKGVKHCEEWGRNSLAYKLELKKKEDLDYRILAESFESLKACRDAMKNEPMCRTKLGERS